MKKIDDPDLAQKFLDKVNDFNVEAILQAGGAAFVFAALPQSTTQPAAFFAVLLTALYYAQGKIPTKVE